MDEKHSGAKSGAFFIAISVLVLAGFPTTKILTFFACDIVYSLSLFPKDFGIFQQQITSQHAVYSWFCANEKSIVDITESNPGIIGHDNFVEQWIGAIDQFHQDGFYSSWIGAE
jgi:hypothetical protein